MSFDFDFTPCRGPSRTECARQGREVLEILERGSYVSPSGRRVEIADAVRRATLATVEHHPAESIVPKIAAANGGRTRIRVVNGTSLASASAFSAAGVVPL